ncbi:transporter substrate-binding domain-containing protein [Paenibacillus macerans]|uniref:transporter substrate-binding domain-containing protein n=1 Tax=Paenibacillus macerans TaxID=44252 RepID=UPI003D3214A4
MMRKRSWISTLAAGLVLALALTACGSSNGDAGAGGEDGIKVGVLFSTSGQTALGEQGMANATLMAIDEINADGGVNGKQLVPIQEDYASDPSMAATKAKKLLMEDDVAAIIGAYTSASRQAVLPIVEQNDGLLVYPMQYEGEEYSDNIIYTGPVPNQGLQMFIPWLTENKGKKFFLIGSDYVFPVETNKQVKALLEMNGGTMVGEEYVPMGQAEFASVINKIKEAKPDIVFSTLVAESVSAFYKQFANYGLTSEDILIASTTPTETDLAAMGGEPAKGHITVQPYFQSVDTPENKDFITNYQKKYGNAPVNTQMEAAYYSVYLLKEALAKTEDLTDTKQLIANFAGLEFQAPQGKIQMDEKNHHTKLNAFIGVANEQGQFDIVKTFDPVSPEPWSKLIFPDQEEPWDK